LTTKIKIDSVEYDVSENGAQAFTKHMANAAAEIDRQKSNATVAAKEADKQKARGDAAEAEAKRLKGELKLAPEKVRAAIETRVAVERDARKILGTDAKFDGLSDVEVKRLAAEKSLETKLDDRSPEYVEAAFEFAVSHAEKKTDEDGILAPRATPTEGKIENADRSGAKALEYLKQSLEASQPKTRK